MATRVFGAVRGAGTQVREVQPAEPILDGPLGSTILVGVFRGGPKQEVVACENLDEFRRIFGSVTEQSDSNLIAEDFFEKARGFGVLYVVGVDDEDSVRAVWNLFSRDVDRTVLETSPPSLTAQAFKIESQSANRRGGRRNRHAGDVNLGTAITGTGVIDLGFTTGPNGSALVKDAWVGAELGFPEDDSATTFYVRANTAAGIFTIDGDFSDDVKNGSDGRYTLELDNLNEITNRTEALAVVIKDQGIEGTKFNLEAWRNEGFVRAWESLVLDPNGSTYWKDKINEDDFQWELTTDDTFTGDVNQELSRPANYAEIPAPGGVSSNGNTITFQVLRWTRNDAATSSGFDPYVDTRNDFAAPPVPIPLKITLTWTSASAFDVAAEHLHTGETLDSLPSGAVDVLYSSPNKWVPSFTITDGATPGAAGDIVEMIYRPLPANLERLRALFYPAAASSEGNTRIAYRVRSNTAHSVTLAPGVDVSAEVTAPGAPTTTGTVAGPYDLSSGTNTVILTIGGRAAITLTSSLSGAAETAADLAADLNAQELARAAAAADVIVEFEATTDQKITITATQDFGPGADLVIGAGGLNARLGLTTSVTTSGASPTIGRLEFEQQLEGGIDGFASLEDADYIQALGYGVNDPLGELLEENTGALKLAVTVARASSSTPSTPSKEVQAAALLWAYQTNGIAYAEIPIAQGTEAEAIAWHETNLAVGAAAGQDYHRAFFPNHGKRRNPFDAEGKLYTTSMVGAILGQEAFQANNNGGYHLAPAGTGYRVDDIFLDLPTGKRKLDNEKLNGYGLTEIRKRGSEIYVFGDRIPGDRGRPFFHIRLTLSHIGRILLTNTDQLVFLPLNAQTLIRARRDVRELFLPWWNVGWFDDSNGPAFEDQIVIRADDTNNGPASRAAGDLNVAISFGVVGTAERVIFTLGPSRMTEETA